jgi:serine/threonine protein kinase
MSDTKRTTKKTSSSQSPGKKIGKYQNAVLLAKGGMGAIYKADHPTLDQPVVLKMLTLTGSEQFAQRFQREATIMMGFQHVNIVNYFDHFKTAKSFCMVMEFVDGCSVAQLLEKHRYLDDDIALLILRDTMRALSFAHEKGVIHRDIKPANILISKKGEVKLTDFGIAHDKAIDTDGLTKEGMTLGTPSYMAPEQFRDAGSVDGRADVYSAGVLLYECLTGRKPFAGSSLPELLERIRKSKYERLRKIRPESSLLSRRIVRRAVRSNPRWRFRDAQRMLRPLEAYISRRSDDSLRRRLADLVADRRGRETGSVSGKRQLLRIVTIAAASLAGLAVASGIWWTLALSGFLPTFLLPDFAGGVRLEVPLPDGSTLPPHVSLEVYQFDSVDINNIKTGLIGRDPVLSIVSRLWKRDDSDVSHKLVVRPVVVKPGLYQLKIRVGDNIQTRAVQIPSMKARRRSLADGIRRIPLIELVLPWEPEAKPVNVTWTIKRADTGSDLTDDVDVRILDEGNIEYAESGNTVLLNTDRHYDFTFMVPGYSDRTVRAWLESGIDDYTIEADLLPEPAILSLLSSTLLKKPRLEGNGFYRHGGAEGGYRRIPFLRKEPKKLILPPGDYRLTAGPEKSAAVLNLTLGPGETVSYELKRTEAKKLEWIEVNNE